MQENVKLVAVCSPPQQLEVDEYDSHKHCVQSYVHPLPVEYLFGVKMSLVEHAASENIHSK